MARSVFGLPQQSLIQATKSDRMAIYGSTVSTILPMCRLVSIRRCAVAASASGNVE
jgi:hypothetical protein